MTEDNADKSGNGQILRLAANVVVAYVGKNTLPASQLNEVIQAVFSSFRSAGQYTGSGRTATHKPAVPIKKSVTPEYLICLEDGAKLKMLKRHLRTTFHMTPDEYRAKWGLPANYPMVAPNYAQQRSAFAKKIGLGRKPRAGARKLRRSRGAH